MIPGSVGIPTKRRRCPYCGHVQMVSLVLYREPVTCRRCNAIIPPSPVLGRTPKRNEKQRK